MSIDFAFEEERVDESFKVGEKGFGTCRSCGKKTMGMTNDLCSRCGGVPVATLLGVETSERAPRHFPWENPAVIPKDRFPGRARPCEGSFLANGDFITVSGRYVTGPLCRTCGGLSTEQRCMSCGGKP